MFSCFGKIASQNWKRQMQIESRLKSLPNNFKVNAMELKNVSVKYISINEQNF